MGKQEIEIEIDKDGNVSLNVLGGEGPTCIEETAELERTLGIVKERERKPEFYKKKINETIRGRLT